MFVTPQYGVCVDHADIALVEEVCTPRCLVISPRPQKTSNSSQNVSFFSQNKLIEHRGNSCLWKHRQTQLGLDIKNTIV